MSKRTNDDQTTPEPAPLDMKVLSKAEMQAVYEGLPADVQQTLVAFVRAVARSFGTRAEPETTA